MKEWTYKVELAKSRKRVKKHEFFLLIPFFIFVVIFSGLLCWVQASNSVTNHKNLNARLLNECCTSIEKSTADIAEIEAEFHDLNQSNLATASLTNISSEVIQYTDEYLNGVESEETLKSSAKSAFDEYASLIGASNAFLCDETGNIFLKLLDSDNEKNLSEYDLPVDTLLRFEITVDDSGTTTTNGTAIEENGKTTTSPWQSMYKENLVYIYSTLFSQNEGKKAYLVSFVDDSFILDNSSVVAAIYSTLYTTAIGDNGFVMASNGYGNSVIYYLNGDVVETSGSALDLGFTEDVFDDNYAGYQTIGGKKYIVAAKKISIHRYPKLNIVVSSATTASIAEETAVTAIFCCLTFAAVSVVFLIYGLGLRRENAEYALSLSRKFRSTIKDERIRGHNKYTDEEVEERVRVNLESLVDKNDDKTLGRFFLGGVTKKGVQHYVSKNVLERLFPVFVFGTVVVFGMAFLSTMARGIKEVDEATSNRFAQISAKVDSNSLEAKDISDYISKYYLMKSSIIASSIDGELSYVSETEDISPNYHLVYVVDSEGKKEAALDEFGNQHYSVAYNSFLSALCSKAGLANVSIFDKDGFCITTSGSDWYETAYDSDDCGYHQELNDVVSQKKTEFLVSQGNKAYVGSAFNYYVYDDNGKTSYCDKRDFEKQLSDPSAPQKIHMETGAVLTEIDQVLLSSLSEKIKITDVLAGLHAYGTESFFLSFDASEDHLVEFNCFINDLSKAAEFGFDVDNCFKASGYTGIQTILNQKYYVKSQLLSGHYVVALVPIQNLYNDYFVVAGVSTGVGAVAILVFGFALSLSSDSYDRDYELYLENKGVDDSQNDGISIFKNRKRYRYYKTSYSSRQKYWRSLKSEQRLGILSSIAAATVLVIDTLVGTIASRTFGLTNAFEMLFSSAWDRGFNLLNVIIAFIIMVGILISTRLLLALTRFLTNKIGARAHTVGDLLASTARYGGIIAGCFYCLYLFGVDTEALWTSLGIVGIVVGLGAQPLLADLIAGIFIVFEGDLRIGDIVTIGGNRGVVSEIGLRTTKIEEFFGNIRIYNNSDIKQVVNMGRKDSMVTVTFSIGYTENLERVEDLLAKELPLIKKKIPAITGGPFYSGLAETADSSLELKVNANCKEASRFAVERALRRELYLFCVKNNIFIPYSQLTISYLNDEMAALQKAKEEAEANKNGAKKEEGK